MIAELPARFYRCSIALAGGVCAVVGLAFGSSAMPVPGDPIAELV